ncbi:MAG: VOC family protein [Bacteroidales bacterium]
MNKQFKPDGYNSVSPYIMVDDPKRFMDMLLQIFDAKEMRKFVRADGSIMHAEIQVDDSIIMLAEANDKYPSYQLWLHIYVQDVDAVFDKAVRYGCEVVERPVQKDGDHDRRGTFKDFAGNYWAVGTQL